MREADIASADTGAAERDAVAQSSRPGRDAAASGCLSRDEILETGLFLDESCSGLLYAGLQRHTEDWNTEPHCTLNDSESEDVLNAINPNEVYTTASASAQDPLSESDSGMSEDLYADAALEQNVTNGQQVPTVYQVVYDISGLGGVISEQERPRMDVISIELDEWSSQMLLSESCVVNELVSSVKMENVSSEDTQQMQNPDSLLVYPELQLTEEEQKLLDQEGISLPNNLPLTKAEERILKKVRRKIRNKLSAQDSRKRKKEYIDGLESRVAACSAQNKELQRTVDQLEKNNMSLLAQLHKLQTLIKQTATKAAQTSTCIMILIFSLGLIIFPSYSPFSWRSQSVEESYTPSGVISRNILYDVASLPLLEDAGEDDQIISDPPSFPKDLKQSDTADLTSDLQQHSEESDAEKSLIPEQPAQRNGTAEDLTDSLTLGLMTPVSAADAAKPPHADEM